MRSSLIASYATSLPFQQLGRLIRRVVIIGPLLLSLTIAPLPAHAEITAEQAVAVFNKVMQEHGFDATPPSSLTATAFDQPENNCLQYIQDARNELKMEDLGDKDAEAKIRQDLKGRKYFTVLYVPGPEIMFGHALCMFVDRETASVIAGMRM